MTAPLPSPDLHVEAESGTPETGGCAPARKKPRVALANVGCKLNTYEVEAFKFGFDRAGYEVVPFDDDADVYVVNTCTVTGSGDSDSRKLVRRANRRNPDATVVATGCYAQRRPDDLSAAGANLVVGNGDKAGLVGHLADFLAGAGTPQVDPTSPPRTDSFLSIDGLVEQGRTRGTLQIQDGCGEHCTYCVIPSVRGGGVSRPLDESVSQARRMVAAGYRELTLTGVHSGSYGLDRGESQGLVELLRQLESIADLERIRLNSVEPGYVTDELIRFAAESEKFCRHFHIPLQSGDDAVLRRMGRHYSRDYFAERVEAINGLIPECAIGTDVMVGFPGETEDQFGNTYALLADLPLAYLHVFPYSARPGTPAERLGGQHEPQTKKARSRCLLELSDAKRLAFHRRLVGRCVDILVEDRRDKSTGLQIGMTDNYVKVLIEGPELRPNHMVTALVTVAREQLVLAELASTDRDRGGTGRIR